MFSLRHSIRPLSAHIIKSAASTSSSGKKYPVLLPSTSFPARLEGDKRVKADENAVKDDRFSGVYAKQKSAREGDDFVLHDGPPYANGDVHLGHAVNKVLKDITARWKIARGRRVHFRPGWDCHGLPLEHRVLKETKGSGKLTPMEIRARARKMADDTMRKQRDEFKSWGVAADWDEPYITMHPEYVKRQLRLFHKMIKRGYLFQRYMPTHWSPSSKTALAESELEYDENHTSTAAYVAFPLDASSARKVLGRDGAVNLLIWTTTPWSLVANKAICFKEGAEYALVKLRDSCYIVAKELLAQSAELQEIFGATPAASKVLSGSQLRDLHYHHPLVDLLGDTESKFPLLAANHVTLTAGTGLVHTAPAHGQDDYAVGVDNNLNLSCVVDENGNYTDDLHPSLQGLNVLGDASGKVLHLLGDRVLRQGPIKHSYPCDWRTKKPVILRASKQWFIDTSALKEQAIKALEGVSVKPETAKTSFLDVLKNRPYWCVSRQRVWGVPIPVFHDAESGEAVISEELVDRCCDLIDLEGTDFWWKLDNETILQNTGLDATKLERGNDILDVWFDSGISWSTCLEVEKAQADLYLEGHDQYSGWFYTSLLTSVAVRDCGPYKYLYVHGFTVDEKGRKMSKSEGNVVSPAQVTRGLKKNGKSGGFVYGVDVMRLWIAAHASRHQNVPFGDSLLKLTKQEADRLRNICKFLLGNLATLRSKSDLTPLEDMALLDRHAMHRTAKFFQDVSDSYEDMHYNQVVLRLQAFLANDLSSFYFHRLKDRLYCDAESDPRRRSAVTALWMILHILKDSFAPIMPILAFEVEQAGTNLFVSDSVCGTFETSKEVERFLALGTTDGDFMKLASLQSEVVDNVRFSDCPTNQMFLQVNGKTEAARSTLDAVPLSDLRELFDVADIIDESVEDSQSVSYSNADFDVFFFVTSELPQCPRCRLKKKVATLNSDGLCKRCQSVVQANKASVA